LIDRFADPAAIMSKRELTNEEELLLQDFSGTLTAKATSLFYGNALIVAALPIWLYWRIYQLDPTDLKTGIIFGVTTILAAAAIAFAYKKTKHILKHSIARRREAAVTMDMLRSLADNKKMSKKEKDERILWKTNEVADFESTNLTIFYVNILFLLLVVGAGFFALRNSAPVMNYVGSTLFSAGVVALFSTKTK